MKKERNSASLVGGGLLILFGTLFLLAQLFPAFNFWDGFWPLIIVAAGLLFYVGMLAAGRSAGFLAIPGSILVAIGSLMFVQNLTDHWESWAYGWTIILAGVGLGIYLMGAWSGEQKQREAGMRVMKIGAVMFVVFGAFFEMIFNSAPFAELLFPILLILIGAYLVFLRSGIASREAQPAVTSKKSAKTAK